MKKLITILLVAVSVSAFGINVTFKVSMKGSGRDLSNGVFVVGGVYNGSWEFNALAAEGDASDSLFSGTVNYNAGDTIAYYFILQDNWTNYQDFREDTLPVDCDARDLLGWNGDRGFIVPEASTTFAFTWSSCDPPPTASGITDLRNDLNFEVYPNPANGFIQLNVGALNGNYTVELFDLSGKTVRSYEFSKEKSLVTLDVSDLNQGLYLLKVTNRESWNFKKVIVN